MKLIAEIVKPIDTFGMRVFHVKLTIGRKRFMHENIVVNHIGPRPWSEMTWMDKEGHIHEVFSASGPRYYKA